MLAAGCFILGSVRCLQSISQFAVADLWVFSSISKTTATIFLRCFSVLSNPGKCYISNHYSDSHTCLRFLPYHQALLLQNQMIHFYATSVVCTVKYYWKMKNKNIKSFKYKKGDGLLKRPQNLVITFCLPITNLVYFFLSPSNHIKLCPVRQ